MSSQSSALSNLRNWAARPGVKRGLRILGLVVMLVGVVWSFSVLDLKWSTLSVGQLLWNALVLTPIILAVAALSFRVTGLALDCAIPAKRCLETVAAANVAELLPLPGGAIVRGAALVDAGASVAQSTRLVLLTSFLTLGLNVMLSLAALAFLLEARFWWAAALAGLATLAIVGMLLRTTGLRVVLSMIGIRLVMLAITVLRIISAFAILGGAIGVTEATLLSVAPTLGATVAIIPGGLGINEAIAAGLATLTTASPAIAFLAVALNRAIALAVGAVIVAVLPFLLGKAPAP